MATVPVRMISEGRVTIPEDIREKFDLNEGEYVLLDVQPFEVGDDG